MNNHVHRAIIGRLVGAPYQSTPTLVRVVYHLPDGTAPSQAQVKSVQRALRRLVEQGIIRQSKLYGEYGVRTWVLDKFKPATRTARRAKVRAQQPRLIS